jgi:hypothetical protein
MAKKKVPVKSPRSKSSVASRSLQDLSLAKGTASAVRGGDKVEAGGENIRRVKSE